MEWGQAWSERHKRGFGGQGLQAGSQGLGVQGKGLGKEVSAERVECWQGSPQDLKSRSRRVAWGQSKGPHPSLNILGSAGVGQGIPGLLKGSARWTDVGDHHCAAVPP